MKNQSKEYMKKIFLALTLFLSLSTFAQVYEYKPNISIDNGGITYFLPKTVIEIRLNVIKESYKPGEFSQYSKKELGIDSKGDMPYETWQIKECNIVSVGIPDKEKAFFIKYKPKYTAPLVTLTKDGLIRGINIELPPVEDNDFTPTIIKSNLPKTENYMTEEMLLAASNARKAKLMAREIFDIRESRNLLLRGEAETMPGDNESLKLVLQKLNEQEQALLIPFTGTTIKEEKQIIIRITPDEEINNKIAFRFSKRFGVVDANDLSGEPYYLTIKNQNTVTVDELINIKNKKEKVEGVVYNVPGKAEITLKNNSKTLFDGYLPVTQFGNTEVLGDVLFNKNSTIKIEFDYNSGAILHIDQQ